MRASVALLFSNIQVASIGLSLAGSYQCPNFSMFRRIVLVRRLSRPQPTWQAGFLCCCNIKANAIIKWVLAMIQ